MMSLATYGRRLTNFVRLPLRSISFQFPVPSSQQEGDRQVLAGYWVLGTGYCSPPQEASL
jgi:hypothetical protein